MTIYEEMVKKWQGIVQGHERDIELANERLFSAKYQLSRMKSLVLKDEGILQQLTWQYDRYVRCLMNDGGAVIQSKETSHTSEVVKKIVS